MYGCSVYVHAVGVVFWRVCWRPGFADVVSVVGSWCFGPKS